MTPRESSTALVRVLVVDDEADAREIVGCVLEHAGMVVECAASVDEAITLFEANPPDVLISDIGMPDEEGYSLVTQPVRAPVLVQGRHEPRGRAAIVAKR